MVSKRIIITGILIILIMGIANAMLSGSHDLYKTETTPQQFCSKCHSSSAANVSDGAHSQVNCLCHGYNPNSSSQYNVNLTHDLTKKIYCTNCHSKYNEISGDIMIYSGISGLNQSAHYIINSTDLQLYNNSRGFFSDTE